MKKAWFFTSIITLCFLLLVNTAVFADKTIKWRMPTTWPKGTILHWQAEHFAEIVNEMSGGRLAINVYPSGALIGAMEVFDAVSMGAVEAGHSSSANWIGKEPAAPFFTTVPMGFDAVPFLAWFYEGDGIKLQNEMYAKYGFGFTAPCGIIPAEDFAWSHKKIDKLEDFKGLKFRTFGFWGEILQELGASVVTLPGDEVYPSLQRKVVDGAEFSLPSIDNALGFHEICKYLTLPGIHQPSSVSEIYISKKAWEKLTPDLRAIVKVACEAVAARTIARGVWHDSAALNAFKAYGTEITYLDPAVQQQMSKLTDDFFTRKCAKDPFFKKVYESQRAWMTTYKTYRTLMNPQY